MKTVVIYHHRNTPGVSREQFNAMIDPYSGLPMGMPSWMHDLRMEQHNRVIDANWLPRLKA